MSGSRLTQQERQQIALGLADGLAFAEIARRLERPTSTVTREVMRNGGPNGYRSDLAQRASERRARRGRPTRPQGQEARARGEGADDAAVREYEEEFTTLLMQQGLPKMAAGVLAALFTSPTGSLTAAELVRHLGTSPASVSKAVASLDELGLVTRERDQGRRERYIVNDDVWYRSTVAGAHGLAQISAIARKGIGVLGRDTPAATRLENIARFSDFVSESILRAAEQAREVLHTGPVEPSGDTAAPDPREGVTGDG
ncbi:GbsR/MarR family transcriptional regulator [Nocardiopsis suaedae]|uniref:Helix-turn-helix domain-containing protein n=1 Tax=Nocardiopsis suaedae TaxID=3018444 RepID=A0ABT4TJ89_9ACTN|nr:helix-turn-helix domain-containing protein [Nocardiopsis suaedae]MDA2804749.1 helix-turn-helix domain-containing protein [Nocardiopsis suaedae]